MAYRRTPRPASWRKRPPARPFTADEDRQLADMVSCGLAVEFYHVGLPDRSLGEVLTRRLQLIEAGSLQRARLI